jgi:Fe2+ or Zn2+ uptake regulation protein
MNNEQPQIQINIAGAPWITCDCGSHLFRSLMMIKKISQFESPTLREEQVPIDIVVCESCGKIPNFLTSRIKDIPTELLAKPTVVIDGK